MNNQAEPSSVFNHALYHLVTHWAATVAVIVGLLSIGVVIVTTDSPIRGKGFLIFAVCVAALMAVYFLLRMLQFGKLVNERLPAQYVRQTMWLPHPFNLALGVLVVVVLASIDVAILVLGPYPMESPMMLKALFGLSYLFVILGSLCLMLFATRFPFSTRIRDLESTPERLFGLNGYQLWQTSWVLIILGAALQFVDYWRR